MPTALCDGIETRYEVRGDGPPLLLFSPGGFNGQLENWWTFGIYERLRLVDELSRSFTCIVFDKRESGQSGGRVERLTWQAYAAQGASLLDHLGIERAHVLGGCIGCSIAITLAADAPERVDRLVLYSPAGGPRYRLTQQRRFAEHLAFVGESGLAGVVDLARRSDESFAQDPRVGPWVSVLRLDDSFAAAYADGDAETYRALVDDTAAALFDRDTVPGPAAERLLALARPALVVPGDDPNHAQSAAHYLRECLAAELWNVPPDEQSAANAPGHVLEFLQE